MKKHFYLIAFLFAFSAIGFSQGKVRLGFEGGPNYASFRGFEGAGNFDPKISFSAGITTEFRINEKFLFKTGVSFERKRATNEAYYYNIDLNSPFDPGLRVAAYIQNDYIVCPFMAKYEFTKFDSFYFDFGGFMAFSLNSDFFTDDNYSNTDSFKNLDFGLSAGIGKSFNIGLKNRVNIEIRENLGIADINKGNLFFSRTINTNSFNLICGYSFDLE